MIVDEPRWTLIMAVREQIAQGTYLSPAKVKLLVKLFLEREVDRDGRRIPRPGTPDRDGRPGR